MAMAQPTCLCEVRNDEGFKLNAGRILVNRSNKGQLSLPQNSQEPNRSSDEEEGGWLRCGRSRIGMVETSLPGAG